MPKKKAQNKKDVERVLVKQSKEVNPIDAKEEYTTVVDYEAKRKYDKRKIESNWAKREAPVDDFECDERERTEDFSFLIKNASSDCTSFELSSEKLWKKENLMPFNEIFNLDLNVLSMGLACLPFYERVDINVSELLPEEKAYFDEEALKNLKVYQPIKENFLRKLQIENKKSDDEQIEKKENTCTLNAHVDCNNKNSTITKTIIDEKKNIEVINTPCGDFSNNSPKLVTEPKVVPNVMFNSNENLEDWLDSVLDD